MNSQQALATVLRHASREGGVSATSLKEAAAQLGKLPKDSSENFLRRVAVERLAAIKHRDPEVELALATLRPDDPETSCRAVPIGRPFHELDPDTGDRTVVIQIAVRRPLDATLRKLLDPQSWDSLGNFFEKSYVIEDGIIDDPVPPQPAAVPQPPGVPRRGTAWKAPLFEVAACDDAGIGVFRFSNILRIHTSVTPGRYRFDYHLHRCAFSEIPGAGDGPGCLVKNEGYLEATPLPKDMTRCGVPSS